MLQDFQNYLRSVRGYSENTIKAYSADLRSYATWANANIPGSRWSTTTREHIDAYLNHCYEQGLKPTTTNRTLASISALYRFFQRQGLNVQNPCKYESRRKLPTTIPTTIDVKELARAYKHAHGLTKIMLGILCTTGIRLQELLDLTYEDIDFNNNTLHIMGKGSKERIVKTDALALETLKGLHDEYNASGRIFYCSQRKARYMIYDALQPYCKAKQLSPHAIRHTFATELAKHGESNSTISKILGHAHLETSIKYINLAEIPDARCNIIN